MTYPNIDLVIHGMIKHDAGNPKLIQHFLKVHEFARLIGIGEGLEKLVQFTLETAAVVHDIGILTAKRKHGSSAGKYQELEGPAEAKSLLSSLGWPQEVIDRVCYLVGHHHTYTNIDGPDYQILVEADFLVNLLESDSSVQAQKNAYHNIFKTENGRRLCRLLYPIVQQET